MQARSGRKPRVIIHGCGNVGLRVARICSRKGWEIVAAVNRAGHKVGQDIGQLAGLGGNLGVVVLDADRLNVSAGDANIAVVATTGSDFLDICYPIYERYLSAGINVIAHGSQPHNPFFENEVVAQRIEALGRKHGATFCGTTIWDLTRIWPGILAAASCLEIECVEHIATGEPGLQNPLYEAGVGFGMTVDDFNAKFPSGSHPLQRFLHGPPVMVLQNLGCTITNVEKRSEVIVLEEARYSRHTNIEYPAGRVGGLRILAEVETRQGPRGRANVEYRLFQEGETELTRWTIHGDPGIEIDVARGDAGALSAASVVNRIPDVISARPGIVEIFSREMGPMSSSIFL